MAEPQQHCDRECVCPDYKASHSDWEEDPDPCTISCYHRFRPAPSPKPIDATGFWLTPNEMKQHDATIRNQTLDEVIKHFEEVMMYHPLGVTIRTLESLRTKEQAP